jgi:hypothetical protein
MGPVGLADPTVANGPGVRSGSSPRAEWRDESAPGEGATEQAAAEKSKISLNQMERRARIDASLCPKDEPGH